MKSHPLARALPTLCVLALLCLAAATPAPPSAGPAPPPQIYPPCESFIVSGGGDSTYRVVPGSGVTQPLPAGITAASCSLRVVGEAPNSTGRFVLEQWDPLTLAPDPGTAALRTLFIDPSALIYNQGIVERAVFVPPLVTRSVDHVAEPPRLTTALEMSAASYSYFALNANYDPAGNQAMPAARFVINTGVRGPLPGTHPVLAHALCGGDADLQSLRVAQSVMRTSQLPGLAPSEVAQRFEVPEAVELRWIELVPNWGSAPAPAPAGLGTGAGTPLPRMPIGLPLTIGLIDGDALAAPGAGMPPTFVEAGINWNYLTDRPVWMATFDFDHTVVLLPRHDYWLYVRNLNGQRLFVATRSGTEGPDFVAGIGPYFERNVTTTDWSLDSGHALSFRIVGKPAATVGAPPPARDWLRLRVSPNPARGAVLANWSGGVGPVQLEIFDARGRRVGRGDGGAAGTWRWSGNDALGAPLPAGVYFLHARDTAGAQAVERLVIVR